MSCETVVKSISLYLYGELSPEAEENVEAHCAGCGDCQAEVDRRRAFAAALDGNEIEPSLDLLVDCRQNLLSSIRGEAAPSRIPWWKQWFGAHVDIRVPVGAMALLAAGYLGARLTSGLPGLGGKAGLQQAGLVSTVRSVEPEASGLVRISVDDVQRRVVSGSPDDQKIRLLLMEGARQENNPGVRVESVSILKDRAGAQDVRSTLLEAVQHDPNPGVRLKALEGLKQFCLNDPGVRRTLSTVLLNDANPGVRIQVIDLLTAKRDDDTVGALQILFRKEDNDYVRVRLQRALREMNASAGTF